MSSKTPGLVCYFLAASLCQHRYPRGTALCGMDVMQIIYREQDCTINNSKKRCYSHSLSFKHIKIVSSSHAKGRPLTELLLLLGRNK